MTRRWVFPIGLFIGSMTAGAESTGPSTTAVSTVPLIRLVSPEDQSYTSRNPVVVTIWCREPVTVTSSDLFRHGTKLPAGASTVEATLEPGNNSLLTFVSNARRTEKALLAFELFLDQEPPRLWLVTPLSGATVSKSPLEAIVSVSEDVHVVSSTKGFLPGGPLTRGEHRFMVTLRPGANLLETTLRDGVGNEETYDGGRAFRLQLDAKRPPTPKIDVATRSIVDSRVLEIRGRAPGNAVAVLLSAESNAIVPLSRDGTFVGRVSLAPGRNRIGARGISRAGLLSKEARVTVTSSAIADDAASIRESTLSVFRWDGDRCEWIRLDPLAREETVLASFQRVCPSVFWSPDGARAALVVAPITYSRSDLGSWSAYEPADSLFEVDLLDSAVKPIDVRSLGPVHVLAYDGLGQLVSLASETASAGTQVTRQYRFIDGSWNQTMEIETTDPGLPGDPGDIRIAPCARQPFPDPVQPSEELLRELDDQVPELQWQTDWTHLGPESPFVFLNDRVVEPPHERGVVALIVGGHATRLSGVAPNSRLHPATRGRYLLTVGSQHDAYLHDASGRLLWSSEGVEEAVFWPRFGRCGSGFGYLDGGP